MTPPLVAANHADGAASVHQRARSKHPPIAQLQAQYGEIWAHDAAAMYDYANQSAAATNDAVCQRTRPPTRPALHPGRGDQPGNLIFGRLKNPDDPGEYLRDPDRAELPPTPLG